MNIAHAYLGSPLRKAIEFAVVRSIINSRELENATDDILEDDRLWDRHYAKYEDEWNRFEAEYTAENDGDWPDSPDYMEEYMQILSVVFEINDGHVYLYPYEIADRYAGENWIETLMEIDGIKDMSDKEIVAEFLKLGTDLEKACRDYLAEEVMTISPGY